MSGKDLWVFVNTFSGWFSALASFAAVVTALYLARRGDRVQLQTRAAMVFTLGGTGPTRHYLNVTVTNASRRDVTVSGIHWRTGFLRKKHYVWITPTNFLSARLPIKLSDGDRADFYLPIEDFPSAFENIAAALSGPLAPIKARFMRVRASTSIGPITTHPVDKTVRDELVKLARSVKSK